MKPVKMIAIDVVWLTCYQNQSEACENIRVK